MPSTQDDFASAAHVLAEGVRAGKVRAPVAGKMLRHELRTMNTNRALTVPRPLWSVRAIHVEQEWAARGEAIPKNGYNEALHCDHVYGLRDGAFDRLLSLQDWLNEVKRLTAVVVVTAQENYRLQGVERRGKDGPAKYVAADVALNDAEAVARL